MDPEEQAEIRASVEAHRDLGPGYDDAVAEGLVERIGAEIDKRIDARLGAAGAYGAGAPHGPAAPYGAGAPYGPPGYGGPARPPVVPPTVPPGPPQRQAPAKSQAGPSPLVVLGSMGLGVAATAIVTGQNDAIVGTVFMVALIWVAIAVINIIYARRR